MGNCEHFNQKGALDNDIVFIDPRREWGDPVRGSTTKLHVWNGGPKENIVRIDIAGICDKTKTGITECAAQKHCLNDGNDCPHK